MNIKPKKHIKFLPREGHWIKKSRLGYYTMERNERVDEFSSFEMKSLFKKLTSFDLRTYPENNEIYLKVAKWLKVKSNNVILTEGADGGLLRIFNVFISGGNKIVALEPSFAMYPLYCKMFNAKYIPFKVNLDSQKDYFYNFINFIKKNKPKLVAIANPNQPVEVMFNLKQIESICKVTKKINCLFVVDEAYYHYNKVSAITLTKKFENLVVVRTFSKAFGLAGLRIGYSVADKKLIGYMKSIKPIYEINSFNIKIINFFLDNIKIMKKNVALINRSRKHLFDELKKMNIRSLGKYSNTVMVELKNDKLAKEIQNKLFNKKFIIRQMQVGKNKNYIRITLGSPKVVKKFMFYLKKIITSSKNNLA